jgi:hypothetical protein
MAGTQRRYCGFTVAELLAVASCNGVPMVDSCR